MPQAADVSFFRTESKVEIVLSVDGSVVAMTSSPESIVNEIQIRGIRFLTIEGLFSVQLPTTEETLVLADGVRFSEDFTALRLLAACSSLAETSIFPYPERRAKPRVDSQSATGAQFPALKVISPR